jgi:hypothetical protein
MEKQFIEFCKNGDLEGAKQLYEKEYVDIHIENTKLVTHWKEGDEALIIMTIMK